MNDRLMVIHEDNHLLVVSKPAGLPTMGTPGDRETLLSRAKQYIKERYRKPGNVYLGVVSRLDAPVSGVVLLARTSKAASRMTEQFRRREVEKTYWAAVEGEICPAEGRLCDWVGQDERHRRMHIVGETLPGAQQALLSYRRLKTFNLGGKVSLVEVNLETGRKHQIRLQLSHHGYPVVGDRKYGSRMSFPSGIALHARRLAVRHPTIGETLRFEAPLPAAWRRFGVVVH